MEPKELLYTKEHEWIKEIEENSIRVGITDYAVEQLGDIVFVELPEEGSELVEKEEFATIESVKSSSEIYAPVSGNVIQVNERLEDEPELVNDSPYEDGWIVEVQTPGAFSKEALLSYEEYQNFLKTLDE